MSTSTPFAIAIFIALSALCSCTIASEARPIDGTQARTQETETQPSQAEMEKLRSCLSVSSSFEQTTCVGMVNKACFERNEGWAGNIVCPDRERAIWESFLGEEYRRSLANADSVRHELVQKAERAWISYRKLDCDARADFFRGGSRASQTWHLCMMNETAQRTIILKRQNAGFSQLDPTKENSSSKECETVSSISKPSSKGVILYEGHAVCIPASCKPNERVGAHWSCPERGGTPISRWEYTFGPSGTRWRLVGEANWHDVSR